MVRNQRGAKSWPTGLHNSVKEGKGCRELLIVPAARCEQRQTATPCWSMFVTALNVSGEQGRCFSLTRSFRDLRSILRDQVKSTSATARRAAVYAESDARPGLISIPVGAFADPNFPKPTRSIWEQSKHSWVAFNQEVEHLPKAPPRPQSSNST